MPAASSQNWRGRLRSSPAIRVVRPRDTAFLPPSAVYPRCYRAETRAATRQRPLRQRFAPVLLGNHPHIGTRPKECTRWQPSPAPSQSVIEPTPVIEGAGVRLRRSIATATLDYLDPFLLLDNFQSDDPADYLAGFPWHPHRGIETVTYMLAGEVDHRDSIGNAGMIGAGDVQWMTAGGGIMHEEMPRPGADGRMGGFQLWVNLPARAQDD